MKSIKYLFIISLAALSCEKGIEKDTLYIRGRLFLTDTTTQNILNKPLPDMKITLSYDNGDLLNFLFSTKTDAEGYFIFNLPDDKTSSYIIRFEDSINGYIYSGKVKANRGDNNVALIATLDREKQNGFVVLLQDILHGPIPTATVLLYNSPILAATNDPSGAIETLSSNNYGRCFKINLPVGTYYLNASKKSGSVVIEALMKRIDIKALSAIVYNDITLQ